MLIYQILDLFIKKYGHLEKKGLRIHGLRMIDPVKKQHVIDVSRPLIFDNRLLPKTFEGLKIKSKIYGELPDEFKIDREGAKKEFIWAPERFIKFVDRCSETIKKELNNPNLDRSEMLSAICFGDFKAHKEKCERWVEEGKIPAYSEN